MTIQEIHDQAEAIIQNRPLAWSNRMRRLFENEDAYNTWREDRHYYLYLNALVEVAQPKQILELGTNQGGSTLFMLLGMPEGSKLATVDIDPAPPANLLDFQDHRLTIVVGDVLDNMIYETLRLDPIDLLFIDTEHDYDQVSQEWEIYQRYMRAGGLVAMDDITINPGMIKFWDELPYPKVHTGQRYHWSGFGVFRVI
jgi:predicted O-methyltransferase YrrM